ncbi:MAG: hypothetical protein KGM42_20805 [Hyphomicrobiales bacterium]|nr:hypothetical protein [Hyphomicrobiales bacterium]
MRLRHLAAIAPTLLAGCAYVPDLESEQTFSYAEIVSQLECETYYAAALLKINSDDANTANKIYDWSMDITLTPNLSYEASINVGSTHRSSLKSNYFQWALGGGPAPGGVGYDMTGISNAKNEYVFAISKLLSKDGSSYKAYRQDGQLVSVRKITPALERLCIPQGGSSVEQSILDLIRSAKLPAEPASETTGARQSAVPNILDFGGFFGVYSFLKRSFAVNNILSLPPKTLLMSKEYKVKIQLGVTPGWYHVYGSISPNGGAMRTVDNTVTLAFAPPSPPSEPTQVVIVGQKRATAAAAPAGQVGRAIHTGVSARQSDVLTNAVNSNIQMQILNKLNGQ